MRLVHVITRQDSIEDVLSALEYDEDQISRILHEAFKLSMRRKRVLSLDLAALVAGAKVRVWGRRRARA